MCTVSLLLYKFYIYLKKYTLIKTFLKHRFQICHVLLWVAEKLLTLCKYLPWVTKEVRIIYYTLQVLICQSSIWHNKLQHNVKKLSIHLYWTHFSGYIYYQKIFPKAHTEVYLESYGHQAGNYSLLKQIPTSQGSQELL